jgi:cytoskeletal protein CcmA (bactofilin family)
MGYIGDDLRVIGGTVTIMNNINGDLIIAGGDVTVSKDVVINGNLYVAGGKLTMNGTVKGIANLRGGEIYWNGIAEKDLTAKGGSLTLNGIVQGKSQLAAQEIALGSDAQLYGDVEYWNPKGDMDFGAALLSGAASVYNPDLRITDSDINWRYLGIGLVAFWIYRLLTAALIIGLFIWMFHRFFYRNSEETNRNYASHLGFGFLYVVGLPLLIAFAFVTIIGIPVGLLLMTMYGLTIALGHILASLLIAYGLNTYYDKNWNRRTLFLVAICGYLALKIVGAIPFLGFLVSIIIVTTAFGTILYIWWKSRPEDTRPIVE